MSVRLINVWIGEPCEGQLEFKQIRATKSRMVGFCSLQPAVSGSEYTYLIKRHIESCAPQEPTLAGLCGALHTLANCDSQALCDGSPNTLVLRRDKFRSGCHPTCGTCAPFPTRYNCEKIDSGRDVRGPRHTCDVVMDTATRYEATCDAGDSCCPELRSIVELDQPYTPSMLESDLSEMRGSVAWDDPGDFPAWNVAGDVIGLEEGNLIFARSTASHFDAHRYHGDDPTAHPTSPAGGPEWIALAWLRVRNRGNQPMDVRETFFPAPTDETPAPEPQETTYTLQPGEVRDIDPPSTTGHITVERDNGCAAQSVNPCIGQFCTTHPATECKVAEIVTAAKDAGLPECFFCAFKEDADGHRALYLSRKVEWEHKYETTLSSSQSAQSGIINATNWAHGLGKFHGEASVVHTLDGCDIVPGQCAGFAELEWESEYGVDETTFFSTSGWKSAIRDITGSSKLAREWTWGVEDGDCKFTAAPASVTMKSAGDRKFYSPTEEDAVIEEDSHDETYQFNCSDESFPTRNTNSIGSFSSACETIAGASNIPTPSKTSNVFFGHVGSGSSLNASWTASPPCPPDQPNAGTTIPTAAFGPHLIFTGRLGLVPGGELKTTDTKSHVVAVTWETDSASVVREWESQREQTWNYVIGTNPDGTDQGTFTRTAEGRIETTVTLSDRVNIQESKAPDSKEEPCDSPVCGTFILLNPSASSELISKNRRIEAEMGLTGFNCGSPAPFTKATVELSYFIIAAPNDCATSIAAPTRKTHELTVTAAKDPEGKWTWVDPDPVLVILDPRAELSGRSGEACLRHPAAIVTGLSKEPLEEE